MPLLFNAVILIIFWLLAIYSTSVYESFTMTLSSLNFLEPTNYYYFRQQLKAIIYIIIVILILWKFPVKALKNHKFAAIIMAWTFLLQCLVFTKLWDTYNGAKWRLNIPHMPSLQPCEFFKLAYVIFLASRLTRKKDQMKTSKFLLTFILLCVLLFAIFLFIPDLWTILIIWATALIMVRYSWLNLKKTLAILGIALFSWVTFWLTFWKLIWNWYIYNRFSNFFTRDQEKLQNEKETVWWQTTQALIAIWWWWFRWNWYGHWLQKYSNLPESYCDFIFAAFSEEVWFVWNMILIGLYIRMFRYVLKHLQKINDPQLKLIWVWLISLIMIQVFVNIWVNVHLLPTTWITLPFISAWWSALMINCIEILLLYKILQTENKVLPVK